MSLEATAELVRKGDPDRFLATMAAPPALRARLFPLYAFNLEVARAPLVTAEPMIAEMRLQWWRDALDEIAGGGPVRRHEVASPLAEALSPDLARRLDAVVAARRRDISAEPFADGAELVAYLDATAGELMAVAVALAGADPDHPAVAARGRAQGLSNWFLAVPALESMGRRPLPAEEEVAALAGAALAGLRVRSEPAARPALLAAWRAPALLAQAARDPAAVREGRLAQSEFARRGSLILRSLGL